MQNKRRLKFSIKIYFYRSNVKSVLSLFSLVFHSSFFLNCVSFFFYIGLTLSHLLAPYLFFWIALSLSFPIYSWNTFREKGQKKKKKKDKEKSRTKVDIEVSWWIADLRTDQLNAFRVNSKRDTLEWCMYDKCSV